MAYSLTADLVVRAPRRNELLAGKASRTTAPHPLELGAHYTSQRFVRTISSGPEWLFATLAPRYHDAPQRTIARPIGFWKRSAAGSTANPIVSMPPIARYRSIHRLHRVRRTAGLWRPRRSTCSSAIPTHRNGPGPPSSARSCETSRSRATGWSCASSSDAEHVAGIRPTKAGFVS